MDLLPGIIQGITRVVISYPFDYAKTHLQKDRYNNTRHFFRENWRIFRLYRGVSLPLTIIPLERGIQYKYYEIMNKIWNPYFSGLICGLFSNLYSLPLQFINNNYILSSVKSGPFSYAQSLYRHHPMSSFYRGASVEIPRTCLSTSLYLGTYGSLRNFYGNDVNGCILSSSIASLLSWTVLFPLDTIRTEVQTNIQNPFHMLKNRLQGKGVLTLWKGILPIYIRTFPSSVLGMLVYEQTRKAIQSSSFSS